MEWGEGGREMDTNNDWRPIPMEKWQQVFSLSLSHCVCISFYRLVFFILTCTWLSCHIVARQCCEWCSYKTCESHFACVCVCVLCSLQTSHSSFMLLYLILAAAAAHNKWLRIFIVTMKWVSCLCCYKELAHSILSLVFRELTITVHFSLSLSHTHALSLTLFFHDFFFYSHFTGSHFAIKPLGVLMVCVVLVQNLQWKKRWCHLQSIEEEEKKTIETLWLSFEFELYK